jgi:uncharacterized membrane protein
VSEAADRVLLLTACGVAIGTLVPVALHQLGLLEHLPDPPGALFESDAITESEMAHPFGVPDGLMGLASYGTTLALACVADRSQMARKALGAKLLLDGGAAGFNATRQVVRFRRVCSWCMGTAVATAVMVWAGRRFVAAAVRGGAEALR